VPNRSLAESWRKWRRRRPAALLRLSACLITAAAMVALVVLGRAFYLHRAFDIREIKTALANGESLRAAGLYSESAQTLSRGLERALSVPGAGSLARALSSQLSLARRGEQAAALHDLAELARYRYGAELPAKEDARALLGNIQDVWQSRDLLLAPAGGTLDAMAEHTIRTDLLDLAILWAELRSRLAGPGETAQAQSDALEMLARASRACGSSTRLERVRRSIAGSSESDEPIPRAGTGPESALEHYDAGRAYLRKGAFRNAALEFEQVRDERPQDFWPNFYLGLCAYRLGQFTDAVAAFQTCTALAPNSAQCYYNRALAYESLGRHESAVRDYGRALALDPGLAPAALNRGIIAYKLGRNDDAVNDFRQALRAAPDSRTIGRIQYNLALACAARGDRAAALASAQDALAHGHTAARALRDRLRAHP
jgi:tetratricopeptide (TPR) repeat protein